jgi:hypothetical protein
LYSKLPSREGFNSSNGKIPQTHPHSSSGSETTLEEPMKLHYSVLPSSIVSSSDDYSALPPSFTTKSSEDYAALPPHFTRPTLVDEENPYSGLPSIGKLTLEENPYGGLPTIEENAYGLPIVVKSKVRINEGT